MNDDKLKEIEVKFPYHKEIIDLITAYRQLEEDKQRALECFDTACGALRLIREDNAELLAALKPLVQKLKRPTADAIIHAHDIYNKHKGE